MIEQAVKRLVLSTLRIEERDYSEYLAAGDIPQWDSLAHVNLIMAVEREFRVAFEVGDAVEIETVGDLIDAVRRYR